MAGRNEFWSSRVCYRKGLRDVGTNIRRRIAEHEVHSIRSELRNLAAIDCAGGAMRHSACGELPSPRNMRTARAFSHREAAEREGGRSRGGLKALTKMKAVASCGTF